MVDPDAALARVRAEARAEVTAAVEAALEGGDWFGGVQKRLIRAALDDSTGALAARDAKRDPKVRAEALREAADEVSQLANEVGGHTSTYSVRKWLRARADREETNHAG